MTEQMRVAELASLLNSMIEKGQGDHLVWLEGGDGVGQLKGPARWSDGALVLERRKSYGY